MEKVKETKPMNEQMTETMTKPMAITVTKSVTKSVTKLNHILQFWTKLPKRFQYRPIRVSASVSDRNQNRGFGCSLVRSHVYLL